MDLKILNSICPEGDRKEILQQKTTGNYFPGGVTCDHQNALNVFRPDGTYTLTASSSNGYYWEGEITFFEGDCGTIELTVGKKGINTGKSRSISNTNSENLL